MASEGTVQRRLRHSEVHHSVRFGGLCKCRAEHIQVAVGAKLHKSKKQGGEPIEEIIYERFWGQTPVGYLIDPLRAKMLKAAKAVIDNPRASAKAELVLERFPQVWTVAGEINARLPKEQRLHFGYTSDEEENTLFVIEKVV